MLFEVVFESEPSILYVHKLTLRYSNVFALPVLVLKSLSDLRRE